LHLKALAPVDDSKPPLGTTLFLRVKEVKMDEMTS